MIEVPDRWKDSVWIPGSEVGKPGTIVRNPKFPAAEIEERGWHGRLRGTFRKRSDGELLPADARKVK